VEETKKTELEQYYGTGRRKTSIARVFLRPGSGNFSINGRGVDAYFLTPNRRNMVRKPMGVVELQDKIDAMITVKGGGNASQAGAARMGIARALLQLDPNLRGVLKKEGFLTRDSRAVERKKYGQKGARKKFQFSKR
jgi:small subunit ribosomal protein S9